MNCTMRFINGLPEGALLYQLLRSGRQQMGEFVFKGSVPRTSQYYLEISSIINFVYIRYVGRISERNMSTCRLTDEMPFCIISFHEYLHLYAVCSWLLKFAVCKDKGEDKEYSILIYIQQDATLHSLFYLETAVHVSGGTTTHYQKRKRLYLQHLVFVTPLLLPVAKAQVAVTVWQIPDAVDSHLRSWWWVVPPETCRAVSR